MRSAVCQSADHRAETTALRSVGFSGKRVPMTRLQRKRVSGNITRGYQLQYTRAVIPEPQNAHSITIAETPCAHAETKDKPEHVRHRVGNVLDAPNLRQTEMLVVEQCGHAYMMAN